jgi:hypothetical protein
MILQDQITLFPEMSETSRIWIYQADRFLTEKEVEYISEKASLFVKNWESHGSKLKADFTLLHHLFLVFSVDENQHEASGCSIDKSVHFVKEVQNELHIDFFNRTIIAYHDPKDKVRLTTLSGIKELISKGELKNNSLIFNNLLNNLQELRRDWLVPAGNSWLSRFF